VLTARENRVMKGSYPFVTVSGKQITAKRIQRAVDILLQKFPDIDLNDCVLVMTMMNKQGTINIEHTLEIPQ